MNIKKVNSIINNFLFGSENSLLLEERMLITAVVIGFFVSVFGAIANLFLGYSFLAVFIPILLSLLIILLFYFIRFKKKYSKLVFPMSILSIIGISIIWIFNGGYNGTNTLILFTVLVLILCIVPNRKFIGLYFFFTILILGLHLFHYFLPNEITQFPNEETRFLDTIITVFYTSSFIYLMISYLITSYRSERQLAVERGKKLEELNKELLILNASKDKLFSIIAHDLKSPFTSIVGFSELLEENFRTYDTTKSEEFIKHISFTSKNTYSLLENLLTWAKSQSGQIEFKPENINAKSLVLEIFDILHSSSTLKNISFRQEIDSDLSVIADKQMLQIILRNLISNAIKFTNAGGEIIVTANSNSNDFQFIVSDNGVGMHTDTLSKLFRIEENYTSRGTANEKGSGLGLVLCKEFIEKHGGSIWVESELGKGSEFKFTIPLKSNSLNN